MASLEHPESLLRRTAAGGAAAVGLVLGAALAVVARARRSKPLHPRGAVVPVALVLHGGAPELGPVLGSAGRHEGVGRFSRGAGLPDALPDIQGLAVRWPGPTGPSDLLLASTGLGPVSRFVLRPRRRPLDGAFCTLMPFRGGSGPVLLAAEPTEDAARLTLRWASARGPWRTFGALELAGLPAAASDALVRFDPVENCPPGLGMYGWTVGLRRYAYRWARAGWPAGETRPRSQTRPGSKASP